MKRLMEQNTSGIGAAAAMISESPALIRRRPKAWSRPRQPKARRRRARTAAIVRRASVSRAKAMTIAGNRDNRDGDRPKGKFGGGGRDKGAARSR